MVIESSNLIGGDFSDFRKSSDLTEVQNGRCLLPGSASISEEKLLQLQIAKDGQDCWTELANIYNQTSLEKIYFISERFLFYSPGEKEFCVVQNTEENRILLGGMGYKEGHSRSRLDLESIEILNDEDFSLQLNELIKNNE